MPTSALNTARILAVVFIGQLLTACGGHPALTAPDPPNAARGLYLSSYFESVVTLLVLPDGRFFVPMYRLSNFSPALSGVGVGQGTATDSVFTGSYRYSGELPSYTGNLSATFVAGTSLTGSLFDGVSIITIPGVVYPPDQYNMDIPAQTSVYSGYWLAGMPSCGLDVKVTKAGSITGTHINTETCTCDFEGTFLPDSKSNLYNVTLNFPSSGCSLQGTATGIAVVYTYRTSGYMPVDKFVMVVTSLSGDSTIITGIQDPSNLSKP